MKAQVRNFDGYRKVRSTLPPNYGSWDEFSQAQYLEASILLPGYILSSQGDRVAMAHAVEGRFPFLDHRVVEFAANLPPGLKMRALDEKYLLRRSFAHLMPHSVRRRRKQPYRAPGVQSFFGTPRNPIRHEYVDDVLSPATIREFGLFAPEAVQRLVQKARAGEAVGVRDNMALVGIISTQLLLQQFVRDFR